MSQSQKQPASTQVSAIPSSKQIYDMLMERIEPDLLSANLDRLADPFRGEPYEKREERCRRYERAFSTYTIAFKEWATNLKHAVRQLHLSAFRSQEQKAAKEEETALIAIEESMSL